MKEDILEISEFHQYEIQFYLNVGTDPTSTQPTRHRKALIHHWDPSAPTKHIPMEMHLRTFKQPCLRTSSAQKTESVRKEETA